MRTRTWQRNSICFVALILFTVPISFLAATASGDSDDSRAVGRDLSALMTQGRLEADLGNFEGATKAFSSVASDETAPPALRWEALVRLGLARNAAGDYRGGAEAFKRVTVSFGDDPEAMQFLTHAVAGTAPGKVWLDLKPQFEDLLESADVVAVEELVMGATGPKQVYLAREDIELRGIFKSMDQRDQTGVDRAVHEIAAYELDKAIGLDMVPPVVERDLGGQTGSIQLWVEGCEVHKEPGELHRAISDWRRQKARMEIFDFLIGNPDRNTMQILVDPTGGVVLVDHTRAFANKTEQLIPPDRFDRAMVDRVRTLDLSSLQRLLSEFLSSEEIASIMARRDELLDHLVNLVAERGEAQVFF